MYASVKLKSIIKTAHKLSNTVNVITLFYRVTILSISSYYTIVAPENIRPHSDYKISVTVHNQVEPAKFRFKIANEAANEETVGELTLDSKRTEYLTLHLNDLKVNENYKFVAEGLTSIAFKNESWLNVESKNVSIFIQTDKGIYKPGEIIRFRILVLDSELRPVSLTRDAITVHVTASIGYLLNF